MAKDNKGPTKEEIAEARAKLREGSKKTLENAFYQKTLGANFSLKNPTLVGQWYSAEAPAAYNGITESKDFSEIRGKMKAEKQKRYDELGVYGVASVDDPEVSANIMAQLAQAREYVSLGELEEIGKNLGAKSDYEVPESLKNYVPAELIEKGEREDKLSEEEEFALLTYEILAQNYQKAAAFSAGNPYNSTRSRTGHSMADIAEKYKPKEAPKK